MKDVCWRSEKVHFFNNISDDWITLFAFCNAEQLTSGHCHYKIMCAHKYMYTTSWINEKWLLYFLKWVYSSGQHFCSKLQRDTGFFYGTWETLLGRGSQRGRWLAVLRAWVKRLRCTNKTATHTESRDAYHPLRGCLTGGEVAVAGHVPLRVTYILHVSFYSLLTEIPKLYFSFIYQGNILLFGLLQTKGVLSRFSQGCERKWEGKCVH